jgi:site-specific DNA-methyltransferase (adenine-specific)
MTRVETIAEGVTLYLGDCREILPTLGKVDAVVTDPPYGIGWDYLSHKDGHQNWIDVVDPVIEWLRSNATKSAVAVGSSIERERHIYAEHEPKWRICHYKGSTGARCPIGFRNWEMIFVWGSGFGNNEKLPDYFQTPPCEEVDYGHPCEKQEPWGHWLIYRLSKKGHTILDPFMGSGTTGVAAVNLGRKFIGIEIEPKYFDLACRRILEATKQQDLFIEKPKPWVQLNLLEAAE